MKAIGGYFELELPEGKQMHAEAIGLNSGRNAFEYILQARQYRKVYLPYYACPALMQAIRRLDLDYEFYPINEQLEPAFDFSGTGSDECFLYINYFGLKGAFARELSSGMNGLVVDNAQAFYERPAGDCFYSPRKFFGVPDGGYAYCDADAVQNFPSDHSIARTSHLLMRIDEAAEAGYPAFCDAEKSIDDQPIRRMSRLTARILEGVDYERVRTRRRENFKYLHEALGKHNRLSTNLSDDAVPMCYPFLGREDSLRAELISKRVYVPLYWPDLRLPENSFEQTLTSKLLPLPIDQRLNRPDLDYILSVLNHEHTR